MLTYRAGSKEAGWSNIGDVLQGQADEVLREAGVLVGKASRNPQCSCVVLTGRVLQYGNAFRIK